MASSTARPVRTGTQVVTRVSSLLRLLGQARGEAQSTAALAQRAGLTRPTAHRLLQSLADEGLVERDPLHGRWLLGPELYAIGSAAALRYPIEEIARPSLRRLAGLTGESAFLSMRRGDETVCLVREEGSFPIRSFVLVEGVRFPLGIASAGQVILAYLPDEEREQVLDRLDVEHSPFGATHSAAGIRRAVEQTHKVGYSVNPGLIVEGSWGMGAAVFDRAGRAAWALSLTGIESRFKPERQPDLGQLLLAEAHRVTTQLRS